MTNNLNRKKNIADATGCDSLKIQLFKEKDFVGKKKQKNKKTNIYIYTLETSENKVYLCYD